MSRTCSRQRRVEGDLRLCGREEEEDAFVVQTRGEATLPAEGGDRAPTLHEEGSEPAAPAG